MASINGTKVNNAGMWDPNVLIQMGMNPKTGLPYKMDGLNPCALKGDIKKILRVIDEQDAIHRYKWFNLPEGLTGELIERILYYKAQGMFFYMPTNEKFYFLPYALAGDIDVYGRYTSVTPVPFNGQASTTDGKKERPWITGLTREPLYTPFNGEAKDWSENKCVLLADYCKQISQTTISRQTLNDPLLDVMSECIPYMRTALINSTGVAGMRVGSEDEYSSVEDASNAVNAAALSGKKWVPIVGQIDFQDLTAGEVAKSEEFLLTMQSLDNFRLATYGLDNGGLFEKKAQELQAEAAINGAKAKRAYNDGLTLRQEFCDIVNSWMPLGISCEASETEMGDLNLDGAQIDTYDQSGIEGAQDSTMGEQEVEQ